MHRIFTPLLSALTLLSLALPVEAQRVTVYENGHAARGRVTNSLVDVLYDADNSYAPGEVIVPGTVASWAFRKFVDNPNDLIVDVKAYAVLEPETEYAVENRTGLPIHRDEYAVSTLCNFELATTDACSWYDAILGIGFHFGDVDRNLSPFDGLEDFAGTSGFSQPYETEFVSPWSATGSSEVYHLEVHRNALCELVGSGPDEWTVVQVQVRQTWQMEYSSPAWQLSAGGGHYPYGMRVNQGNLRFGFLLVAEHESGDLQF